ncbi:unnamed protein product, partial [Timema podura]|nr:unnamed protein product [Timema podura]
MNEMKPGERPDTIHISNLPCKWFASKQDRKETKDVPKLSFEGYVQFKEYVCFVKAMDALRGMKLLYKEGDKAFTASIK